MFGSNQSLFRTGFSRRIGATLRGDPFAKIGVTQFFEQAPAGVCAWLVGHAEREAIRDAQRRTRRDDLSGCAMYSTSRPCNACQRAAAQAKVARMYYGPEATDAGAP